jgi:lipooligosaccharide transport system permease protein
MAGSSIRPGVGALRVWRRNFESWKRFSGSFLVAALGNPIFYLASIGYGLGRFVANIDGLPYAVFLTPGILATAAMNSASFETTFGSFTRLHEQNTFAAILATPCSVADIVAGDLLWAATKSALAVFFVLIVTGAAGLLPSWLALGTLPVAFLSGLTFAALGMIATARAGSYAFFDYYFTLGISVMVFFCGVFFPLASLPVWAQDVAWFLPLTHAVRLSRSLVAGAPSGAMIADVAWLVTVAVVGFVVAERLIRRRLIL